MTEVMYYTSNSYNEIMEMPVYTFMEIVKNIQRLNAKENLRLTASVSAGFAGDTEFIGEQRKILGDVVIQEIEDDFDKAGFEKLKKLLS